MRLIVSIFVLVATAAIAVCQTTSAQEQAASQDIRQVINDYRNKAIKCKQSGDSICSEACVEAINLVRNGPSSELDAAAASCNAGFDVIESEREKRLEEPALREGYAWMPDIEATVIRARGAPFLIKGRDHDWGKYCTGQVRFGGAANDAASKALMRSPGTNVILRHVQYPVSGNVALACVIGDVDER